MEHLFAEGAGGTQCDIGIQQVESVDKRVGIPIPAVDQTHENSVRIITTIIAQLLVALTSNGSRVG